ncbi:hypothetical protein ACJJTC_005363, partial [Scirpophaga incertulas]
MVFINRINPSPPNEQTCKDTALCEMTETAIIWGDPAVSWIRHRDLHILTVGGYTYTSDQRFQATRAPHADDWTLHVKWAQQRDAGVYECQVSTQPVSSFFVTLHVVDCGEIYQRMFSDQ